jgi:hypothetical protein
MGQATPAQRASSKAGQEPPKIKEIHRHDHIDMLLASASYGIVGVFYLRHNLLVV